MNSGKSQDFSAKFHIVDVACRANKCDKEMALFTSFNPEEKQENPFLPDPSGSLSVVIPSSTIKAANKAVKHVFDDGERNCTHKKLVASMKPFLPRRRQP